MYYKYEMHCHDRICSKCADSLPEEMAKAYFEAGYSGVAFTNHFLLGNTAVDLSLSWEEKMRAYYGAYLRAAAWAKGRDFTVFFGIEHKYGYGKEVLTYGIDLDFLLSHPGLERLPLREYARLVREHGGYVAQAHPFRRASYIDPQVLPEAECLDAVETYNFCNQPKENLEAERFAEEHGLYGISGADAHGDFEEGIGRAGMAFPEKLTSSADLVQALRERRGRRIVDGRIQ